MSSWERVLALILAELLLVAFPIFLMELSLTAQDVEAGGSVTINNQGGVVSCVS